MHPASSAAWRGTTGPGCAEKQLPTTAAAFRSGTEDNVLTHLRAEAESAVACLDMTSIRAWVVSENFEMSTGAGTLRCKVSCP